MTLARYIVLVAACYVATFCLMFALLGRPVVPVYEAVAGVIAGAGFISAVGTLRVMQIARADDPPYLMPTVLHTTAIAVIIICTIST